MNIKQAIKSMRSGVSVRCIESGLFYRAILNNSEYEYEISVTNDFEKIINQCSSFFDTEIMSKWEYADNSIKSLDNDQLIEDFQDLNTDQKEVNSGGQLVLTRRISESIIIGDIAAIITVLGIRGCQVRLGIKANKNVSIHREEIYNKIIEENGGLISGKNNEK